jgi:hypothetical protein
VRGTKLDGWLEGAAWRAAERASLLPEAAEAQRRAVAALKRAQAAVARQVVVGIGETIGLLACASADGLGVYLNLPDGADPALTARANEAEGVTAWVSDEAGRAWATVGVAPWYGADEIDHAVLCVAKVAHVLFGLHPPSMDSQAHAACGWHGPAPAPADQQAEPALDRRGS